MQQVELFESSKKFDEAYEYLKYAQKLADIFELGKYLLDLILAEQK